MSDDKSPAGSESQMLRLLVRRTIRATPERLFEAWTQPTHLKEWWGPKDVECVDAQVDLRVGGRYRIANRFPDGKVVWIAGEFEVIEPPHKLVYTWRVEPESQATERVTVRFEWQGDATEVMILHERILNVPARDMHEKGWQGCLDGLAEYLQDKRPDSA
jgi:uncharacterized protein YndB with AHSA1/START domain